MTPFLIVILGPTASGKTSFSIDLALCLMGESGNKVEIINSDSRQLYRYLDIGTAKITHEEMHGIPHHLIDVLDPKEDAGAGWYQTEAMRIIGQVIGRGNFPLLVGGSMLYISSITDGLTFAPAPPKKLRQRLIREYQNDLGKSLHEKLLRIDPVSAGKIHQNNKNGLIRAIEICELTDKIKSEAVPQDELRPRTSKSNNPLFQYSNTLICGLCPPRDELYRRINERTRKMFKNGLVEEVRGLIRRGYGPCDPGIMTCGYREIMEALKSGDCDEEELISLVSKKTRHYARRQLTWWRGDERIKWI